jgi:hypothetical protein
MAKPPGRSGFGERGSRRQALRATAAGARPEDRSRRCAARPRRPREPRCSRPATTLEIDWFLPPAALAAELNVLPSAHINGDDLRKGRVTVSGSRHASGRALSDAAAVADLLRNLDVAPIARTNAGQPRATPRRTAHLRTVLAELLLEFPGLTPGAFLHQEGVRDHVALVRLRERLGRGGDWTPDRRTIFRDVGAESPGGDRRASIRHDLRAGRHGPGSHDLRTITRRREGRPIAPDPALRSYLVVGRRSR